MEQPATIPNNASQAPAAAAPMPAAPALPPGVSTVQPAGTPPGPAPAPAPGGNFAAGGPAPGTGLAAGLKETNWVMVLGIGILAGAVFFGIWYYRNKVFVFSDKQKETDFQIASLQSQVSDLKKKEESQ